MTWSCSRSLKASSKRSRKRKPRHKKSERELKPSGLPSRLIKAPLRTESSSLRSLSGTRRKRLIMYKRRSGRWSKMTMSKGMSSTSGTARSPIWGEILSSSRPTMSKSHKRTDSYKKMWRTWRDISSWRIKSLLCHSGKSKACKRTTIELQRCIRWSSRWIQNQR